MHLSPRSTPRKRWSSLDRAGHHRQYVHDENKTGEESHEISSSPEHNAAISSPFWTPRWTPTDGNCLEVTERIDAGRVWTPSYTTGGRSTARFQDLTARVPRPARRLSSAHTDRCERFQWKRQLHPHPCGCEGTCRSRVRRYWNPRYGSAGGVHQAMKTATKSRPWTPSWTP